MTPAAPAITIPDELKPADGRFCSSCGLSVITVLPAADEPAGDDCRTYRELSLRAMGATPHQDPAAAVAARLRIAAAGGPVFDLDWLGMFADDELPARGMSPLDALASRMQERLVYDSETYCDDKVIRHLKAD